MAKSAYRPVTADSVIGHTMAIALVPLSAIANRVTAMPGAAQAQVTGGPLVVSNYIVAKGWGDSPDMNFRYEMRKTIFYCFLLYSVATGLLSNLIYVLADNNGYFPLFVLGVAGLVMFSLLLGMSVLAGYRSAMARFDHDGWMRMQKPESWVPGARSQPRNRDLLVAALVGSVFAIFFLTLVFQK